MNISYKLQDLARRVRAQDTEVTPERPLSPGKYKIDKERGGKCNDIEKDKERVTKSEGDTEKDSALIINRKLKFLCEGSVVELFLRCSVTE
jgi:hypothetical protein